VTLIDTEPFSRRIIGCAIEVHKTFGPGLTESIYEAALCRELDIAKLRYTRQQRLPVIYQGDPLDIDLRIDLVVKDAIVVELKSVQALLPVHEAQLHTYVKISGIPVGLLLNFKEVRLIDSVRRRLLQPVTAPSLA
jgi:GxxExxY protein